MIKILKLGGAWSDLYLMKTNLKVTCWADYMGDKVKQPQQLGSRNGEKKNNSRTEYSEAFQFDI